MICANCEHEFEGNYCSNCGQKAEVGSLKSKDIFKVAGNALIAFENRAIQTIKDFYKNPRLQLETYSSGKRKYYASPLTLFYFLATLSFGLHHLINEDEIQSSEIITSGIENKTPEILDITTKLEWAAEVFSNLAGNYTNIFELGFPLVFGFVFYLFYFKRYNIAESYAFAFYFLAFALELSSLISMPFVNTRFEDYIDFGFILIHIIYVFSFFQGNKIVNFLKGFLCTLISIIIFLVSTVTVLYFLYPVFNTA